ncbi:MAG TPA: alpha-ketoglutarate-dependent dioxygenase AlkB [Crocinitomix sp.]|nr:alpha-ketoglutarate-dependent dioxygenase AlkB [Crocinitomix sp.]
MDLFSSNNKKIKLKIPDADVTLYQQFFSEKESNKLLENLTNNIHWQQDHIKIYGKTIKLPRLTAWYGYPNLTYTYSGIAMNPKPWNNELLFLKDKIEKELKVEFTSCLLNRYKTGNDYVGWHQDNEKELGKNPIIASVSFGQTRIFQLKHIYNKELKRINIPLNHGSLLVMKGTTQHYWKHQIQKTTLQIQQRINLTFRIIKDI